MEARDDMPSTLEYQPLQDGEIRLLSLDRLGDSSGLAAATLVFTTVSIKASAVPPFVALSYVWGDPSDTVPLTYSGGTISVTRNLRSILSCLASLTAPDDEPGPTNTRLWIDALCIDQMNLGERAAQVSLMRQVYSRASSVLVFLSTISAPFEVGLSFLEQAAAHPEWHYEPSLQPHITVQAGLDARSQTLRDSVIAFFAAPWWTRVWTVQEFVLAGRATFRCGRCEIDAAVLLAAFASLRDHEGGCCWAARREADGDSRGYIDMPSSANGGLSLLQATMRLDLLHAMRNDEGYGERNLLGALALFRTRDCLDPRDHIFGILGLDLGDEGEDLRARMRIDYTVPATQLFEDAASAMIQTSGKLDVLSHICQYSSLRRRLDGLPSWVPDWTATVDNTFHRWYSERTRRTALGMASGDRKPVWNRVGAGRVVTKALVLGTISTTAPGYPASSSCPSGKALLDSWREVFGSEGDSEFGAVLAGGLARVEWHGEPGRHEEALRSWRAWFAHGDAQTLPESTRQDVRWFDDLVKMTTLERRMFRTGNGRVGFGPESAAEGYVVVVMPGGRVPYMLQEMHSQGGRGKEYGLLGDCFVQGVMLGEAVAGLDEGTGGWEHITLV